MTICFAQLDRLQSLLTSSEPELALRGASVLAPRLTDATGAMPEPGSTTFEACQGGGQGEPRLSQGWAKMDEAKKGALQDAKKMCKDRYGG